MTRPTQETIETFMTITGASEAVALQKLEEYGGNLNEAVNAYFSQGDRDITNPTALAFPQHNNAEMNNHTRPGASRLSQLFSVARSFKPSSLLDSNYRRSLLNELSASPVTPYVSHTEGTMGLPAQFSGRNEQRHHSGMPSVYDGRPPISQDTALRDDGLHLFANNVEEEMVQAAIEASKRENSSGSGLTQRQLDLIEDDEFSRAISLSLKTAKQEKVMRDRRVKNCDQQMEVCDLGIESKKTNNSTREPGNSSVQGVEVMSARPPVSYKSKCDLDVPPQHNKDDFPSIKKFERWLAAKEVSLPQEPAIDDGNAITLLVKMPDGSRHGRRFLKSDKLQVLFDFIDVGKAAKPGTYRVVRPFPRRAFNVSDGTLSLNELGLTSKQELMFLEFI